MDKIVIMGASSGIGLRVAEEFACRGIVVGLAARRVDAFNELKKRYPKNVEFESIDINKEDAPLKLASLIEKMGGMDIYFHVSGIGYDNPPLDPEREAQVINTNSAGFARMVSAAFRYYRDKQKPGRIVALTSVAGTKGIGSMAAYSASKKCAQTYLVALEQLANTQNLKIKFTDIRPGWIRTPLLKDEVSYRFEMSLAQAVPLVIRAIVKAPRVAVIDWKWNIIASAWRLIPDWLWIRVDSPVFERKDK